MSQINTGSFTDRAVPEYTVNLAGDRIDGFERRIRESGDKEGGHGLLTAELPPAERVRSLARHTHCDSVAYQSVAVAGIQILERVLRHEKAVASASLSLAQRDKLATMIDSLEKVVAALTMSLSAQGSKMHMASNRGRTSGLADERSWWFALTEAIQSLDDGIDAITGIVACQPKGGAARVLGGIIARLLHRHHNELLSEAEQWIG